MLSKCFKILRIYILKDNMLFKLDKHSLLKEDQYGYKRADN